MNSLSNAETDPIRDIRTSNRRRRLKWAVVLLAAIAPLALTIREVHFFSNPTCTGVYFRVKFIGPVRWTYDPNLRSLNLMMTSGENAWDAEAVTVHVFCGKHNRIAVTDSERSGFMLDERTRVSVR